MGSNDFNSAATTTVSERLANEIELLNAMYPDQVKYDIKSNELKIFAENSATLVLRLPEHYPGAGLPDVISITGGAVCKGDLRQDIKIAMADLKLCEGEEVLDAIIQAYLDLLFSAQGSAFSGESGDKAAHDAERETFKVVIVWLHHLLATGKRKLALSPTITSSTPSPHTESLSGCTKPGYPGIMVFSGPSSLVDAHVAELKSQRWQAFQVRYDEEYEQNSGGWKFQHGNGISEFESLSELVQDIADEDNRQVFLKAVGVK